MKLLATLGVGLLLLCTGHAQTDFGIIASNRIVQKYHNSFELQKIAQQDSARLEAIWQYLAHSFSYTSSQKSELSLTRLLNVYHFDVYEFEAFRMQSETVQISFRDEIQVTLISRDELSSLIGSYTPDELLTKLPARPFPLWTSASLTDSDFQNYKEEVWDWARDFPQEYLIHTADTNILHVRFANFVNMDENRRANLLASGNYLLID